MLQFSIERKSFKISGDTDFQDNPEQILFLSMEMGFDETKDGYIFKGEITSKLIFDIYQYFKEYNTK